MDKDALPYESIAELKDKYISFIAQLNKEKHPFEWEALNFVSKSRLSFDFCYRLFDAFISKGEKKFATSLVTSKKKDNNFCIPLCLVFFRTIFFSLVSKILFGRPEFKDKHYQLIKTLVNAQSFIRDNRFEDVYFHKLIDYLRNKNTPIIVDATVFRPYFKNLLKIKRCIDDIPIIPREFYTSTADICKCFIISLKRYIFTFELGRSTIFENIDLGKIVKAEIRKECGGSDFFLNLLEYYSIRSFLRNVQFDRVIYPFEHRSWEAMLIAGLRKASPGIKIFGYQHTSIAPKHTNFLLGKDEADYIFLPDKIICMGKATKEIMQRMGNFPAEKLKIGCALRQNIIQPQDYRQGDINHISNILVALTTDTNEYFKVLTFLDRAFANNNTYNVRVRPHPITEIERGRWLPEGLAFTFEIDCDKNLNESLSWAHIVLYASSTVSIEAIERGIPVLYLDLGDPLCPDPLFEIQDFKWPVSSPEKLIETINYINNIPKDVFNSARTKASEYASEYIVPATQEKLKFFLSICEN